MMRANSGRGAEISFPRAMMLAALIVIGYLVLLVLFRNEHIFSVTMNNFLLPIFNGLAAVGLLYAAQRSKIYGRRASFAWTILFLGQLSFLLGDLIWAVLETGLHQETSATTANIFYLMYYPLFAFGILLIPAIPLTPKKNLTLLLDTGIVMVSAFLVFWAFLFEPTISASRGESTLALATTLAYPAMDLILFFALLQLLFRRLRSDIPRPLLLLSIGITSVILIDVASLMQSLQGTFTEGNFLNLGRVLSYLFIGLAGVLQANSLKDDTYKAPLKNEHRLERFAGLTYLPYICAGAAYILLVWSRYYLPDSFSAFSWGLGIIIGFVSLRQVVALDENVHLYKAAQMEIDERKETEVLLRQSEESYRDVFEAAPDVIFTISSTNAVFTSINPAFEKISGWSVAEWLGKPFLEIIHPDDLSKAVSMYTQTLRGQDTQMEELRYICKSGEYLVAEIKGVPQILGGKIVGKLGFARDVTERKRSERALQNSEISYRLLAENMTDVIWKLDLNLKYTYISPSFERMSGYSSEEIKELTLEKILTPDSLKIVRQALAEELENEKKPNKDLFRSRTIEVEEICKDGRTVWIEVNTTFLRDHEGRPIGIQGCSREITARKRTEKALIESEEKYRTIFENTGNATLILDEDTTISFTNTKSYEFFGFPSAEIVGKSWTEFIHKDDIENMKKYHNLRRLNPEAAPRNYEFRLFDREGKIRYVFMTIAMIPGTKQSVASLMDITQIKRSENRLRASLEEKEMLLKEVHHRVKNNMQVIYSLLSLQSERIEDPQTQRMFKESQNRVKSMAMIHEKLYRSEDLARINFAEYLRSLTADLYRSYRAGSDGIQLKVDVQDVFLGIDTAIPCGLITNELVSNSLKYAFPAGTKGEIHIELLRDHNREFSLIVSDNGIGFPGNIDFRNTESLGLQLVNTLTGQLGGTIELDRSSGTAFRIIFSE